MAAKRLKTVVRQAKIGTYTSDRPCESRAFLSTSQHFLPGITARMRKATQRKGYRAGRVW